MAADLYTPWLDLWQRSTQVAFGAPWPCAPSSMIESQQQVCDQLFTAGEMGWGMWMGLWSPAALMSTRSWDGRSRPPLSGRAPGLRPAASGDLRHLRLG